MNTTSSSNDDRPDESSFLDLQPIERVNVSSDGDQAQGFSFRPSISISADGRYVAFSSSAENLVPGDTNQFADIFVRDRQTGQTTRVNVADDGTQAHQGESYGFPEPYDLYIGASISGDGRYVAFNSAADNLVPGDTNEQEDIFVRDRQTGQTTRITTAFDDPFPPILFPLSRSISQVNDNADEAVIDDYRSEPYLPPAISSDGRYVAYRHAYGNEGVFVYDRQTGETIVVQDLIDQGFSPPSISTDGRYISSGSSVYDHETGQTERVDLSANGTPDNDRSGLVSFSPDGRYVTFVSSADNLVLGDTNGVSDIFVRDRQTGRIDQVSVASDGSQANGDSGYALAPISTGGRYVAFYSEADNLVPGDTNGVGDIFRHDRQTGETIRVNVAADGSQLEDEFPIFFDYEFPTRFSMSSDGRYIAFSSGADNLVPGDTNFVEDIFVRDLSLLLTGNPEPILGTHESDELMGSSEPDVISGGSGNDRLLCGGGSDRGYGNSGDDFIDGSAGEDLLFGGRDNDTLLGGANLDVLYGDTGNDLLAGDEKGDRLLGGEGEDTLYGGLENDDLQGERGNDVLFGETGDDRLYGQEGDDTLCGGEGNDLVLADGVSYLDRDTSTREPTHDVLYGNQGDDTLEGTPGANILSGGQNDDFLTGGAGNDALYGDLGNDTLIGIDPDVRTGSPGLLRIGEVDTLTGGAGADLFIIDQFEYPWDWAGSPVVYAYDDLNETTSGEGDYTLVTDFDPTQDIIRLADFRTYQLEERAIVGNPAILDTYLYRDSLVAGGQKELIAIVSGVSGLNLDSPTFIVDSPLIFDID